MDVQEAAGQNRGSGHGHPSCQRFEVIKPLDLDEDGEPQGSQSRVYLARPELQLPVPVSAGTLSPDTQVALKVADFTRGCCTEQDFLKEIEVLE